MLKNPTSRRRSKSLEVQINLVPMMDALVTLIAFLLYTMALLNFVHIETIFPEASTQVQQKKLLEKPLQLTVSFRQDDVYVWSPFQKFEPKTIKNLSPNMPDLPQLKTTLIEIKSKFLNETKVVIAPNPSVTYDVLIAAMDTMRLLEPTDPPLFAKNQTTGIEEQVKMLFPEVIFGNLLGE